MEWRINSVIIPYCTLLKVALQSKIYHRTAVKLSYKVLGDEDVIEPSELPPIFILHGFLGMKRHWESLGKTMISLTKRSVVVVDQRNHGDSPHASSHKYKDMAGDVLQLLDKMAVNKAVLLGHSMGGKTSMCVSLLAPHRVAGLLVVDISPVSTPPQFTEVMPKLLAYMKAVKLHPKKIRIARKMAKKQLREHVTDEELLSDVLSNIRVNSKGAIGWACNVDALMKHFEQIAAFPNEMREKKFQGPTLFIGGQYSDYIPPDDLTKIRHFFPSAVVNYVPKTGHYLHIDDPRSFLEYCIAFSRNIEANT